MKITRCSGTEVHFFDGDKYSVCPTCGKPPVEGSAGMARDSSSADTDMNAYASPSVKPGKSGRISSKEQDDEFMNTYPDKDYPSPHEPQKRGLFGRRVHNSGGKDSRHKMGGSVSAKQHNNENTHTEKVGTVSFTNVISQQVVSGTETEREAVENTSNNTGSGSSDSMSLNGFERLQNEQKQRNAKPIGGMQSSRTSGLQGAALMGGYLSQGNSDKTVGRYSYAPIEPVSGWLICVRGGSFGESYPLKEGKNFIGRGEGMDVRLSMEKSVSRDKHAIITYEPKKRKFLIQPGESSGMVYLNDDLLMGYAELKAYDLVQLGESLFKFVPFCGEQFTWDDYIDDKE